MIKKNKVLLGMKWVHDYSSFDDWNSYSSNYKEYSRGNNFKSTTYFAEIKKVIEGLSKTYKQLF